jgi:23S rRNA pseudouridine1911/1915/1917 synthase
VIEFAASEEEAGERADVVVTRRTGLARAAVQAALRSGDVTVAGKVVRPGQRLRAGDEVRGGVAPPLDPGPHAEDIPVSVRYSDEHVIVVSKPAGLVTHPAHGHGSGTLVNALLGLGGSLAALGTARPGIVHRLDKDTSGLLLVAKDDETLARLQTALRRRAVRRDYLALVRGVPAVPSGSVDAPVGRDPGRPTLRAVVSDGKPAVTHFRKLAGAEFFSLLEVSLETGRTHQIRVHLSYIGHPVMGDRAYGGGTEKAQELGLTRPFLHAHRLSWPQPDGREMTVTDDLPEDLAEVLVKAGLGP